MISLTTRQWEYYKDLIFELTNKELKLKYKSSMLGFVWSLLLPFSHALVYFVAFKYILRIKVENYALFLIVGLFVWQWFANSILAGTGAVLSNGNLIKKTKFPYEFLVVAVIISEWIHFIFAFVTIFIFLGVYGIPLNIYWLFIPFLMIIQSVMNLGSAFFVASITVFFRDMVWFINIFLNMFFYLTPIIYPIEMIPDRLKIFIVDANPMALFVALYRQIIIYGTIDYVYLSLAVAYSIVLFLFGWWIFAKLKWKFAEVL